VGCVAARVGGDLTSGEEKGDLQSITDLGKQLIDKILQAHGKE
jgi:hypothetical protein